MTTIEPGTPVRVIIEGTLSVMGPSVSWLDTGTAAHAIAHSDPAVQVVPVDPERPTVEQVIAKHAWDLYDGNCDCDEFYSGWNEYAAHLAEQLRAAGLAL